MSKIITISFIIGHRYGVGVAEAIKTLVSNNDFPFKIGTVACIHPRQSAFSGGYSDPRKILLEQNVQYLLFNDINEKNVVDSIMESKPNIIFLCGLRQILNECILKIPSNISGYNVLFGKKHGVIGIHPGFLPDNAGASPVQWAILTKADSIGVTAFFLDGQGIDSGPIITYKKIPIVEESDAEMLNGEISNTVKDIILEIVSMLNSEIRYFNQNKTYKKTGGNTQQLKATESWLDFSRSANELTTVVRAFTAPYRMAFFVYSSYVVYVNHATYSLCDRKGENGEILSYKDNVLTVQCNNGIIHLYGLIYSQDSLNFKLGEIII